jgi:sugar/nucleoside kinase (ribokinase family)
MKSVLQSKDVDILSLNENEAICYATQMKDAPKELKGLPIEKAAKESAKILASHLSARVDLHTTKFSATFDKKGVIVVPSFKVPVMRATGAGDAWNAGNIWADAHRITTEQRLALANAVAAYYVSNPNGTHPTRRELIKFCEKLERKKHIRRASK